MAMRTPVSPAIFCLSRQEHFVTCCPPHRSDIRVSSGIMRIPLSLFLQFFERPICWSFATSTRVSRRTTLLSMSLVFSVNFSALSSRVLTVSVSLIISITRSVQPAIQPAFRSDRFSRQWSTFSMAASVFTIASCTFSLAMAINSSCSIFSRRSGSYASMAS